MTRLAFCTPLPKRLRAAALRIATGPQPCWVRPERVAEVKFLTWTDDNLLRQVVYGGLREDKPAAEMSRPSPRAETITARKPHQG